MENTESYDQFVPFFLPFYLLPVSSTTVQQDFPFYIRIPESLPPTIALEKGGRFRLQISPRSAANCDYSRYQVRVDCYGLHQGQKVRGFRFKLAVTCSFRV